MHLNRLVQGIQNWIVLLRLGVNVDERFQNDRPIDQQIPAGERSLRFAVISGFIALALALFLALKPASAPAAWEKITRIAELKSDPGPAAPANFSEHLSERVAKMKPQEQSELLLEGTINHYSGAIEQLSGRVDGWRGHLNMDPRLSGLLTTALNSNDLQVRAAGIEVELAAYHLAKSPRDAQQLMDRIASDPAGRSWALWMLGAMGNRGVETERALEILRTYSHDPNEKTRFWAVEGMSLLGSDAAIEPMLDAFRNDPSQEVREGAGCGIAQSGMLTKEQRMKAVPALIKYAEDPAIDASTRTWVFQALRDISGENLGSNSSAWRNWWTENAPR
jgi:hypothetical protein